MPWYVYVASLLSGALLANGVPHFVQGICGNKFQTPFASPPLLGLSSAIVNVIWGWLNFVASFALFHFFFPPELPPPTWPSAAVALGALIVALYLARHFGSVRERAPHP
jgi:hypothetical protein